MNVKIYLLGFWMFLFFSACDSKVIEYENSFEVSKRAWFNFKASSGDSYTYTAKGGSWTGTSWGTVITVEAGEVVRRAFSYDVFQNITRPSNGWTEASRQEILQELELTASEFEEQYGEDLSGFLAWQEEGDGLGEHEFTGAADPLTLDEVYFKAEYEWLLARENAETYFEAEINGLLSLCGYVEEGCQDDCFIGINIGSIEAI